jgi:hypothetical protein
MCHAAFSIDGKVGPNRALSLEKARVYHENAIKKLQADPAMFLRLSMHAKESQESSFNCSGFQLISLGEMLKALALFVNVFTHLSRFQSTLLNSSSSSVAAGSYWPFLKNGMELLKYVLCNMVQEVLFRNLQILQRLTPKTTIRGAKAPRFHNVHCHLQPLDARQLRTIAQHPA